MMHFVRFSLGQYDSIENDCDCRYLNLDTIICTEVCEAVRRLLKSAVAMSGHTWPAPV